MLLSVDGDRNGHINVFKDNLKNFPKKFKGVLLVVFHASIFCDSTEFCSMRYQKNCRK